MRAQPVENLSDQIGTEQLADYIQLEMELDHDLGFETVIEYAEAEWADHITEENLKIWEYLWNLQQQNQIYWAGSPEDEDDMDEIIENLPEGFYIYNGAEDGDEEVVASSVYFPNAEPLD